MAHFLKKNYLFFWRISITKMWQNSKTRNVTKLKNWNCDKTQKFKLWHNSKTENCYKSQKLQLWKNSKTQIVTKLKKSKGCLPEGFCTVRFPSSSIMGPPPITELVRYWDGTSSNQRPVGLQLCQKPLCTQQPFTETSKHWRGGLAACDWLGQI